MINSKILCIHQGKELYGSDRSFLAAVEVLTEEYETIDVVLPGEGELADELAKIKKTKISYYSKGVLRKRDLKSPVSFVSNLIAGFFYFLRNFYHYPVVYINTVVVLSALLAASFYRFTSKRIICHVREIPSGWQLKFFRFFLWLSGVELIYNSEATKLAFSLPGKVVYNGVSVPTDSFESLSTVGKDSKKICLLMIGRINEWKGQSFFIKSVAQLSKHEKDHFRIRIVGSPFEGYEYLSDELTTLVNENGLEGVVSLIDFCADPKEHYLWSDYVVVPSTQPEPFGRVAIEAFSYGKPVLAANHGGLTEIVEEDRNGFLFEPGNQQVFASCLTRLIVISNDKYAELSYSAHQRFTSIFSIESYRSNLLSIFRN